MKAPFALLRNLVCVCGLLLAGHYIAVLANPHLLRLDPATPSLARMTVFVSFVSLIYHSLHGGLGRDV